MFLGLLDETSCVRGGDLASISTVFLPDERRGLGTPRQRSQVFVNFTNKSQVRKFRKYFGPCWAGRAGGETEWWGRANNIFYAHLPFKVRFGEVRHCALPTLCFPLVSLKPDTCAIKLRDLLVNLLTNTVWSFPGCRCSEATERGASQLTAQLF